MFTLRVVISVYLLSVSQSASLSCEDLVRPLDHLQADHLAGRWAMVAGSLSHPASLEALKLRDSITVAFSNSNRTTNTISYTQTNRFGDRCLDLHYDVSIDAGGTFAFHAGGRFNLTGAFLLTSCPDCVVMRWDVESRRRVSLDVYLVSKRREVEPGEMEEYRAQLECLGLPPPVVMGPNAELCPA